MCKSVTQETPFALAFGIEAVAPVEVGLKSPRIEFASAEHNEEVLRLNLDLLEEKRERVLKRIEDYHKKTSRYYDPNPGITILATCSKENSDNKERPHTWETGTQLGRALYPIPHSPT